MADRPTVRKILVGDFTLKRVIRSLLLIAIMVYVGLFLYSHFFFDRIAFQAPPASYSDSAKIIKLTSAPGVQISAMFLTDPGARYTILYSHGNAEDIGMLEPTLVALQKLGFNVLAYDYRGYGTSAGRPSEKNGYADANAAYDYLVNQQQVPPNRVIALGRSLGGAVAVDLASRRTVGGLILESTFTSAYRVFTRFPLFPFDKMNSLAKIGSVHCPVLIIHGRRDEIISFWHGNRLFAAAHEPKMFLWVESAGHNDLFEAAGPQYGQALQRFATMIDSQTK
jgi:fermentation-respiration switch protein FrsA (DUF1100 family)